MNEKWFDQKLKIDVITFMQLLQGFSILVLSLILLLLVDIAPESCG